VKYLATLILFGAVCFAGENRRPVCNAKVQGQFWPEEANSDRDAARRLYQSGELEMCSLQVWKYKWEHISVNVRDLGKSKRTAASSPARHLPGTADTRGAEGASASSR
jgi:hypothetical protein